MYTCFLDIIDYSIRIGFPIPLIALLLLTFFIVYFNFDRWGEREKYYYSLLKHLGVWKDTLSDRLAYYQEPNSCYNNDIEKSPFFIKLEKKGTSAFEEVREEFNVARIFLSENSVKELNAAIEKHWENKYYAINMAEYLKDTSIISEKIYQLILKDAKSDLNNSRFSKIIKLIKPL